MTRAVVALLVSVSLMGCFPHSPQKRTYAKIAEGSMILAGIAIGAFANTTADCDEMTMPGVSEDSCHSKAKWMSTAGVILVVGGLLGFVATVSTAEDEAKPKPIEIKAETPSAPAEKPADKPAPAAAPAQTETPPSETPPSADPNAAGSASTTPSAPQK